MAISTTITGNVSAFALTQLAESLGRSADEHKRLARTHRRMAQTARHDQGVVLMLAERAGSPITITSEGE